ncbi:MAG: hypothetical protein JWL59_1684 [Chthoniobacteraceae bacterium]|nr:hypothetical protein [Chthoniobacteraceae bacterium]
MKLALVVFLFLIQATFAAEPFELKDGDRVLLMGDTLLERENGWLELRMREQFPNAKFIVRNLAMSADTPLGASRASFEPVEKGIDRIKEQLALVKPTVAILGYGMAAALEELTYRSNDPTLNPDPVRYGTEHSAAKFKRDLGRLMELIATSSPEKQVRFVLLNPLRPEDLRESRPTLPDPAKLRQCLEPYSDAIKELANERSARFLDLQMKPLGWGDPAAPQVIRLTENGIHPTSLGWSELSSRIGSQLGWKSSWRPLETQKAEVANASPIHAAILRRNALFFYRWRPSNETYLLGFRKNEQGRNAAELPKFDPLTEKADNEIAAIASGRIISAPLSESAPAIRFIPQPHPEFTVAEGLEISLFAENPLLEKPVQMNWDAQGRLWVASSSVYPQIEPGAEARDKIIVLEDTDHDGKADKSTVFADGLLIPTGVIPDGILPAAGGDVASCYVAASTELLHFGKPGPDGKATERKVVLSGFGTEDTHHLIHTLHWAPDGLLYFHQSIYIHSHVETPWGVVRANSGAVFAYDPRTERLEVFARGMWNSWGQQEDRFGQTFLSDGAGYAGLSWAFPGAVFTAAEGARRSIATISPGAYPKFSGLELIRSPHFPNDWQDNAITCDFRAHRIVRFGINDLALGGNAATPPAALSSGYSTSELPDVVRTSDMSFRPIDVKLGPDGALYVADWSNPVINHGEVDFRDPRRDKHCGRIWRITCKERPLAKWEPMRAKDANDVLKQLYFSENSWALAQATQALFTFNLKSIQAYLWSQPNSRPLTYVRNARVVDLFTTPPSLYISIVYNNPDPSCLIHTARHMGEMNRIQPMPGALPEFDPVGFGFNSRNSPIHEFLPLRALFEKRLASENPRVRLEAVRALARIQTPNSVAMVLDAAVSGKFASDDFLDFATWQSVNDLAWPWVDAVITGAWKIENHEAQLEYALNAVPPAAAAPILALVLSERPIARDGGGPWIELIGKAGGPVELRKLLDALLAGNLDPQPQQRAFNALLTAARDRAVLPTGDLSPVTGLFVNPDRNLRMAAIGLAGFWKLEGIVPQLAELALLDDAALRNAALESLRSLGQQEAFDALSTLAASGPSSTLRRAATVALAPARLDAALARLPGLFAEPISEQEALELWRGILRVDGAAELLEKNFPQNLSQPILAAGLKAARETGYKGALLAKVIEPLAGKIVLSPKELAGAISGMVFQVKVGSDPSQGEMVYRRIGCVQCHAIGGAGGKLGPDLTSLGASAPLDYIIESVLDPAGKVKEGYHAFAFTMKDGSQITGIPTRETATEQFLRPGPGQEIALIKTNLVRKENVGSIMPAGLVDALDFTEKRSLFAFLGELGKPGVFDASKGSVARVWWLYPDAASALKGDQVGQPIQTLVDGRLPRELLAPLAGILSQGDFYATTRFEMPAASQKPFVLLGAKTAWLDGKSVETDPGGRLIAPISAGPHLLAVKLDSRDLPQLLRAQSEEARFLGD